MSKVEELKQRGAVQLSRRYRLVAVLPEGKTGLQCLREARPHTAAMLEERLERWAKDMYLNSAHAVESGCQIELTYEEFNEWLHLHKRAPLDGYKAIPKKEG